MPKTATTQKSRTLMPDADGDVVNVLGRFRELADMEAAEFYAKAGVNPDIRAKDLFPRKVSK